MVAKVMGLSYHTTSRAVSELNASGLIAFAGRLGAGTLVRLSGTNDFAHVEHMRLALSRASEVGEVTDRVEAAMEKLPASPVVASEPPPTAAPERPKPARSSKPPVVSPKPVRQPPLTDDERALICQSIDNMKMWLRFGRAGIGMTEKEAEERKLASSTLDWKNIPGATAEDPKVKDWSLPQFAGWWWYIVSHYRAKQSPPIELSIPHFPRLLGDIKHYTGTRQQLYRFMRTAVSHWRVVQWMCGPRGKTMRLDETTLSNNWVSEKVQAIMTMSPGDLRREIERMEGHHQENDDTGE